ncbi:MAG: putative DNA-binding domain-containing protein [Moraxellaceae bacterium]|nr:putative DNA-binding domain-containing protein [Moraxellaceae bacterium]
MFNNVSSFVENTFPIVKQQLPASQWMLLLKNFFALHYCQSPYFHDISYEFLQFLATQHELLASYPWLTELAHFEWIELAAEIFDDAWPQFIAGDFWHNIPVMSPFAWPLVYQWPVQRFAQSKQPFRSRSELFDIAS